MAFKAVWILLAVCIGVFFVRCGAVTEVPPLNDHPTYADLRLVLEEKYNKGILEIQQKQDDSLTWFGLNPLEVCESAENLIGLDICGPIKALFARTREHETVALAKALHLPPPRGVCRKRRLAKLETALVLEDIDYAPASAVTQTSDPLAAMSWCMFNKAICVGWANAKERAAIAESAIQAQIDTPGFEKKKFIQPVLIDSRLFYPLLALLFCAFLRFRKRRAYPYISP